MYSGCALRGRCTGETMGISVDPPVLSNGDLMAKKLQGLSNTDVHHPKQGDAMSPARKPVSIGETEEFDDEFSSGDEKVWQYAAEVPIAQVDDRDKGTSDDWVPRHPELVRLTGRHPFNCEPPLSTLMEVRRLSFPSTIPQTSSSESENQHFRTPQVIARLNLECVRCAAWVPHPSLPPLRSKPRSSPARLMGRLEN